MRRDAMVIFRAGLEAVDPRRAVERHLRLEGEQLRIGGSGWDLSRYRNLYVVGAGKAAAAMALALEDRLGERIRAGIVNVKTGYRLPLATVQAREAGHPVPDQAGLEGTLEILRLLEGTGPEDLVFCLLSGGGSALLPCPAPGLTLEDKRETTRLLLDCGAEIHEINAIRKHLSRVKGGRLARMAHPSPLICLILSDVVGDDLDAIASGPTVPDPTTYQDCLRILRHHRLLDRVPPPARELLEGGCAGRIEETPKREDPRLGATFHAVIGNNSLAVDAARREADRIGYRPQVLSTTIQGESREAARVHADLARRILQRGQPVAPPACIISGGETTVRVEGDGQGGPNQEFALAAAIRIAGLETVVVLSADTDGTDGPTDAAGGLVDDTTVARARRQGLVPEDFLGRNDSHHFLHGVGDLLVTGPTFTNVMDLRLLLAQ